MKLTPIASDVAKEAAAILAKVGGSALSELNQWGGETVIAIKTRCQIKVLLKMQSQLQEAGLPLNIVRWNVLFPALNTAALQDEEEEPTALPEILRAWVRNVQEEVAGQNRQSTSCQDLGGST